MELLKGNLFSIRIEVDYKNYFYNFHSRFDQSMICSAQAWALILQFSPWLCSLNWSDFLDKIRYMPEDLEFILRFLADAITYEWIDLPTLTASDVYLTVDFMLCEPIVFENLFPVFEAKLSKEQINIWFKAFMPYERLDYPRVP